jgi:predicted AlkP superfamily phosphohydrolase/phosphomutase
VGGVRLNLISRENHGIVNPGREAEELLAGLSEDLLQIRNAESGEPLIAELTRTDAVYEGPERRQFPDLLLRWNRNHPIRRLYSPRLGVVEDTIWRPRSGDHLPNGMFFATGPDISSSW